MYNFNLTCSALEGYEMCGSGVTLSLTGTVGQDNHALALYSNR